MLLAANAACPTQVKQLTGAPLLGRPLALPTNTRLGWKGLPGQTL
jgi:hypothetical protein